MPLEFISIYPRSLVSSRQSQSCRTSRPWPCMKITRVSPPPRAGGEEGGREGRLPPLARSLFRRESRRIRAKSAKPARATIIARHYYHSDTERRTGIASLTLLWYKNNGLRSQSLFGGGSESRCAVVGWRKSLGDSSAGDEFDAETSRLKRETEGAVCPIIFLIARNGISVMKLLYVEGTDGTFYGRRDIILRSARRRWLLGSWRRCNRNFANFPTISKPD